MTAITKRQEVTSIFENDVCIGFIARRCVVFGVCEIGHRWCVTKDLKQENWGGAFCTRKQAIEFLGMIK